MAAPWIAVLDFWFREVRPDQWFVASEDLDAAIRDRFAADVAAALDGNRDDWAATPRGRLALIILIDQFTRNIFRDEGRAYAGDTKAQALVLTGLKAGEDAALTLSERQFFYMPLMHAEDPALQARSVALFEALAEDAAYVLQFARGHRDVVAKFGRFPMRNDALGRESSDREAAYLAAGGGYSVD